MWTKRESIKTNASKKEIWKLWIDVKNWNIWDDQVVSSSLDGEFKIGQTGQIRPKEGPKNSFKVVEITSNKSFTTRLKLPLSKMDFIHKMEEKNDEIILIHEIQITGFLTFLFSRIIGEKIIKELPRALNKLSELAQNN